MHQCHFQKDFIKFKNWQLCIPLRSNNKYLILIKMATSLPASKIKVGINSEVKYTCAMGTKSWKITALPNFRHSFPKNPRITLVDSLSQPPRDKKIYRHLSYRLLFRFCFDLELRREGWNQIFSMETFKNALTRSY